MIQGPVISAQGSAEIRPELKKLKKACEQFEAVFAKKLLAEMRKGVKETQIGDQAGSEIYKDMMDEAIAGSIAHQGSLGIGKMLFKQFEKQVSASAGDENAAAPPPNVPTTPQNGSESGWRDSKKDWNISNFPKSPSAIPFPDSATPQKISATPKGADEPARTKDQ